MKRPPAGSVKPAVEGSPGCRALCIQPAQQRLAPAV